MLKIMNDLPDNALGVSAEGKVTAADYETILMPAVEEKLKSHKKIRFLYHLGNNFSGFGMGAMLDDAKIGMKHLASWDRIALVSDHQMIDAFAKFFGHLISCEVRVFKDAQLEKAKKWISEK